LKTRADFHPIVFGLITKSELLSDEILSSGKPASDSTLTSEENFYQDNEVIVSEILVSEELTAKD
jgi:hypothetical protein